MALTMRGYFVSGFPIAMISVEGVEEERGGFEPIHLCDGFGAEVTEHISIKVINEHSPILDLWIGGMIGMGIVIFCMTSFVCRNYYFGNVGDVVVTEGDGLFSVKFGDRFNTEVTDLWVDHGDL